MGGSDQGADCLRTLSFWRLQEGQRQMVFHQGTLSEEVP